MWGTRVHYCGLDLRERQNYRILLILIGRVSPQTNRVKILFRGLGKYSGSRADCSYLKFALAVIWFQQFVGVGILGPEIGFAG